MMPKISLHALVGQVNPKALRITGQYFEHKLQILIDGGSTHNFLQERVAFGLGLPVIPTKPFKVFVGNDPFFIFSKKCLNVPLNLQSHHFEIEFYVLPIEGADMVLGIQWLETLGPILTDYKLLTMNSTYKDQMVCLKSEPQLHLQPIKATQEVSIL
ncbi:RVP_2 domain-containing protein [Cephalotus follicularis]|uniref:RVP_2 domain-containing protein n=1 Tax=Cephalotus follicularis TaxID=3775 RepID=A0A1Q3BTL5_CEPFO|nr:RVP_2 domain-containing protein [Cephalotus follicularis]